MTYVDASKSEVTILVLNEKSCEESWQVSLPHGLSERTRKKVEAKLEGAGFKLVYQFEHKVVDKRSLSLAKAQAASLAKRIMNRTGIRMEIAHHLHISG